MIGTYDADDAASVCDTVRQQAEANRWIPQLVEIYESAITEFRSNQDFWTTRAKIQETEQMAKFMSAWSKEVDLVGIANHSVCEASPQESEQSE